MKVFSGLLVIVLSILVCYAPSAAAAVQPDNMFPRVKMVTSHGDIVVELHRHRAPLTVKNFLKYVEAGSYNGTIFHRIVPGFVVQGGGYDAEFTPLTTFNPIPNESGNGLKNSYGTIAMARESDPHSATRQFFFNSGDNESLDPSNKGWGYAVFGWVVEGQSNLDAMAEVESAPWHEPTGWQDVPVEPPVLIRIEVLPPS